MSVMMNIITIMAAVVEAIEEMIQEIQLGVKIETGTGIEIETGIGIESLHHAEIIETTLTVSEAIDGVLKVGV